MQVCMLEFGAARGKVANRDFFPCYELVAFRCDGWVLVLCSTLENNRLNFALQDLLEKCCRCKVVFQGRIDRIC